MEFYRNCPLTTKLTRTEGGKVTGEIQLKYNDKTIKFDAKADGIGYYLKLTTPFLKLKVFKLEFEAQNSNVTALFVYNRVHFEVNVSESEKMSVILKKGSTSLLDFDGSLSQEERKLEIDLSINQGQIKVEAEAKLKDSNGIELEFESNIPGMEEIELEGDYEFIENGLKATGNAELNGIKHAFEFELIDDEGQRITVDLQIKSNEKFLNINFDIKLIQHVGPATPRMMPHKRLVVKIEGSNIGSTTASITFSHGSNGVNGNMLVESDNFPSLTGKLTLENANNKFSLKANAKMTETIFDIETTFDYNDVQDLNGKIVAKIPELLPSDGLTGDLVIRIKPENYELTFEVQGLNARNSINLEWKNKRTEKEFRIGGEIMNDKLNLAFKTGEEDNQRYVEAHFNFPNKNMTFRWKKPQVQVSLDFYGFYTNIDFNFDLDYSSNIAGNLAFNVKCPNLNFFKTTGNLMIEMTNKGEFHLILNHQDQEDTTWNNRKKRSTVSLSNNDDGMMKLKIDNPTSDLDSMEFMGGCRKSTWQFQIFHEWKLSWRNWFNS